MKPELTEEQKKILGVDLNASKNIILIEALAGTGKTTTLLELARTNTDKRFRYLSYMAKISGEVEREAHKQNIRNLEVSTFHKMARGKVYDKLQIRQRTMKSNKEVVAAMLPHLESGERYDRLRFFKKFCAKTGSIEKFIQDERAKAITGTIGMKNAKEIERVLLDVGNMWEKLCSQNCKIVSHDFYLKYFIDNLSECDFSEYDVLLVDEAQDLNEMMHKYVFYIISLNKPVVMVGDSSQSIMGFIKSKNILKDLSRNYPERTTRLPLTHSFRFAKDSLIEEAANTILRLRDLRIYGVAEHESGKIKDIAYIGRTNKGVLEKCYELASSGLKYDLCDGIKYFEDKSSDMNDIYNLINRDLNKIRNTHYRVYSSVEGLKDFAEENEDIELLSNISLVLFIAEKGYSIDGFFDYIESGVDAGSNIKISTIHKAKGMGFDEVHILPSDMFKKEEVIGLNENNGVWAINDRDHYEEINLLYVAVTRAKKKICVDAPEYLKWLDFLEKIYVWKSAGNSSIFICGNLALPKAVADEYIRRLREPGSNSPKKSKPTDTKQRQNNAAPEAKTNRDPIRMPFVGKVTCTVCNTDYENSSWDKCPRCGAKDKKPCTS